MTTKKTPSLRELRDNLRAWTRTRLWAQVLIGLVLGIGVGALLGPDLKLVSPQAGEAIGKWLSIPGQIFLGLISLVLVPLVGVSIIQGITGSQGGSALRRLGGRLLVFVLVTTTIAAVMGVVIAEVMKPGALIRDVVTQDAEITSTELPVAPEMEIDVGGRLLEKMPDIIVDMLPTHVSTVLLERDMLAIVIISVLVGIACLSVGKERTRPFLEVLAAVLEISMIVVKWAMFLAPLAVFGLIAQLVIQIGLGTMGVLASYVSAVLIGLAFLYVLFLTMIKTLTKQSVGQFARSIAPVQLMAFSTSSTASVMPLTIETAESKLDVRPETANLVIPLAATINMAGTALYQTIAILFLAQAAGLELSIGTTIGVVVSVVAASVGAPGTPGVGVVILSSIAVSAGIPTTGLPLVLGLDRPLDMVRTAVNVTGDLTACVIVDGK